MFHQHSHHWYHLWCRFPFLEKNSLASQSKHFSCCHVILASSNERKNLQIHQVRYKCLEQSRSFVFQTFLTSWPCWSIVYPSLWFHKIEENGWSFSTHSVLHKDKICNLMFPIGHSTHETQYTKTHSLRKLTSAAYCQTSKSYRAALNFQCDSFFGILRIPLYER